MLDSSTAITLKDALGTIGSGAVVGVGLLVQEFRNRKKRRTGDSTLDRIEKKIDDNHAEVRQTCQVLAQRLDDVEGVAENALSQVIGAAPDRKNGVKSRVADLEQWQESVAMRERNELERLRIEREHGLGPTDVGRLTPRLT